MPDYNPTTAGLGHQVGSTPLGNTIVNDLQNLHALLGEVLSKTRTLGHIIVGDDPESAKVASPPSIQGVPNGFLEGTRAEIRTATNNLQLVFEELRRIESKF